jgi:hypothetical protein
MKSKKLKTLFISTIIFTSSTVFALTPLEIAKKFKVKNKTNNVRIAACVNKDGTGYVIIPAILKEGIWREIKEDEKVSDRCVDIIHIYSLEGYIDNYLNFK